MATYQRYQTLSSAEQYLFSPSCPVWVQKYQLSWDLQSGSRLLQCRMVNVSEKTVAAVYLRVLCRDEQGQDLTALHLVPVPGLHVPPGAVFGDDKVLTLWPKRTAYVEAYPERICFADGTAWNELGDGDYAAIPAPAPVRAGDPAYGRLKEAAREGGVRNDYYFRSLKQIWLCTCGLPNSSTVLRCRHCGADRTWLEQHMDPERKEEPVQPAAQPAAPAPAEETAAVQPQQPQVRAPLEKFDLASYLNTEPMRPTVPMQEESREEPPAAPEPELEEGTERHGGRTLAIVLAILLFLGIGAWFVYRELLGPYLAYERAVSAEYAGDYAQAIEGYRALGDYRDCEQRIEACELQIALDLMRAGDYAAAYERLITLPGGESYAIDCLYSQGVLAYNDGDLDTAWQFVERLSQEAPTYDKLEELHDCCCYGFGTRKLDWAGEMLDENPLALIDAYLEARSWYIEADGYSNSADMVTLCDYYIASQTEAAAFAYNDSLQLLEAIDQFAALGSYMDSAARRLDCMFEYCLREDNPGNATTVEFLEELMTEEYNGAEELYDRLFPITVKITLSNETTVSLIGTTSNPSDVTHAELEQLRISFNIEGGRDEAVPQILLVYTLPGSQAGSVVLNPDCSRSGNVKLYDVIPVKATEDGEVKLQFYNAKTGEELKIARFQVSKTKE